MRLSAALPLVLLPALALAHNDPLRPANHRRQLARHGRAAYGKRVPAIDEIFGGGSSSSSTEATSTASGVAKSTSGVAAATSAVATSEAATATSKAAVSTSTATTSSEAAATSQAATSTVKPSSAGKSSTASSAAGSSSPSASASVSASASASSSIQASSAASTTAFGSPSPSQSASASAAQTTQSPAQSSSPTTSAAQSVQYTTDSSGQTQMVTVILTQSADDDASTANAAATASSTAASTKSDGSLSTGAIIGICVGVGVAVLALIGLALCRMRKRSSDEDEAIRWPELNRHGDSDVHHALPARETGQHGFETSGMSRPLSSGSSIHYADYPAEYGSAGGDYLGTPLPHTPVPMALGGSNFGASSTLEDEYDEKYPPSSGHLDHSATHLAGGPPSPNPNSLDEHDNYSSLPPPVQPTPAGLGMGGMMYGQGHPSPNPSEHAMLDNEDVYGGMGAQSVQMTQMGGGVTYPHAALTSPVQDYGMEYPDYPRGAYRLE
ncbi:hypothetical protein IAR50_001514 [Cryptococcus sp. DSM 104548]